MTDVDQVLQMLARKDQLLIALDRDGTIVPYADKPKEAIMTESMRQIVKDLALLPKVTVAIVSARGVIALKNDLLDVKVTLAGNYGMEILFPDGKMQIHPQATEAAPILAKLRLKLTELTKDISGSMLEDDIYCLCVHWHLVPEEQRPFLHKMLRQVEKQLDSKIYMRALPTSYEFMPNMVWDKGHALQKITGYLGLNYSDCLTLYIGDTQSDEPAFHWANKHEGMSIRVGAAPNTAAHFVLPETKNVAHFLKRLNLQRGKLTKAPIEID